jgi:hypothetical protein
VPEDRQIEFVVIIAMLCWIGGFGLAAAQSAIRLDRVASSWFVFGAILGPIALILLRAAPPGRCRSCGTPTRGWLRVCTWCGYDVASTPATTVAMVARMSRPAMPGERDRPRRVRFDAFRRSMRATTSPGAPKVASTTPPSTFVSRPLDARSHLVLERNGSHARVGGPSARASKRAANSKLDTVATRVLATAVYVTGSKRLEPGRRYGIAVHGSRLHILGPIDIDPSAIVLDRSVVGIDAIAIEGRIVVSEPRQRSGLVLAFMSVAGATIQDLAQMIREAARASIKT